MSRTPKSKKKQTIKPQYFTKSQQTLQLVLYSVLSKMLHRGNILQHFYRLKLLTLAILNKRLFRSC